MFILIPVNGTDEKKSEVIGIFSVVKWALVDFNNGVIKSVKFFDNRKATGEDWIDFIILENKFESYMEFMEDGMMVLVVREEKTIEDIIEAFKFKELDEIGV